MKINKSISVNFRTKEDIEFFELITLLAFQRIIELKRKTSDPHISIPGLNRTFHVEIVEGTIQDVRSALNFGRTIEVKTLIDYPSKEES